MDRRNDNNDEQSRPGQGRESSSSTADSETSDLREANENIRKSQGEDATDTPVDSRKTGNRPRFDRDR